MKVKIKKLHPNAIIPTYATDGSACFDLFAMGILTRSAMYAKFTTGLAVEVPKDHVMMIYSRSGHAAKQGVRLANCVGVIDSDYRGEVCVMLQSDNAPIDISPGDRIAQAMIIPVDRAEFDVVDELSETNRGSGGFGSTGK